MKKLTVTYWFVLVVGCLMLPAFAATAPDVLVRETSEKVLFMLEQNKAQYEKDPESIYKLVDEIILPNLDFIAMSKLALGKNWNTANSEQQARFVEAFKGMLIRTYSKSLTEYTGQKVEFLPYRPAEAGKMTAEISSRILQNNGPAIPIDYRLRLKDEQWKVYDITIDGISLVTNYRNSFASDLRAVGMDGLIEKLNTKRAEKIGGGQSKTDKNST